MSLSHALDCGSIVGPWTWLSTGVVGAELPHGSAPERPNKESSILLLLIAVAIGLRAPGIPLQWSSVGRDERTAASMRHPHPTRSSRLVLIGVSTWSTVSDLIGHVTPWPAAAKGTICRRSDHRCPAAAWPLECSDRLPGAVARQVHAASVRESRRRNIEIPEIGHSGQPSDMGERLTTVVALTYRSTRERSASRRWRGHERPNHAGQPDRAQQSRPAPGPGRDLERRGI
jgi:hypothetical protein